MGASKRAIISEETRVFKGLVPSSCRLGVQKKVGRDGRSGLYVVLSKACLVPSQRVLRHNGSADHLRTSSSTATMAGGTATSSEHRTRGGTSLAHLLNGRARALVQLLSLAVAAGNPEHTRTVSGSTGHNTDSDSNRASLSLGAPGRAIGVFVVTAVRAIITATIAATASRVASTTWVVSRELEGDCRVNHRHQ